MFAMILTLAQPVSLGLWRYMTGVPTDWTVQKYTQEPGGIRYPISMCMKANSTYSEAYYAFTILVHTEGMK